MAGNNIDFTKEIARAVKFHRTKSGLNQKQLADLADVGKTAVFDIEKGKESVRLNTLLKVFKALNIKMKLESPLMHLMENENEKS
ncbi:MAG: helix-turn-helix domain-containing protein [Bacteroidetes bacterium]|nr:helix-turn-helix domain-containing protein [Bacteroidota bacterium]